MEPHLWECWSTTAILAAISRGGDSDAVGADADAANADAAGSGDADAAGLLLSWLPYQGEEKGAMLRMLFRC